jgi:hypothetical protein
MHQQYAKSIFCLLLLLITVITYGQEVVPINEYRINDEGRVELTINSNPLSYYILEVRHNASGEYTHATSITIGSPGTTLITESLKAYPENHYQIRRYSKLDPGDYDDDGINDIQEFEQMPLQNPLNAASEIEISNGLINIDNFSTFNDLSVVEDIVQWSEFLNGKLYVKFIIVDFLTSNPKLYFINTETHSLHEDFSNTIGIDNVGDQVKRGQIIFHPTSISPNGTLGNFAFNFSGGAPESFSNVQKTFELLGSNMPFIKNNLSFFITQSNESQYETDINLYDSSRISVLFEADVYAAIDYWGLHPAEGYGFFREVSLGEVPGPKDIVLYEAIPNSLPRVGGIMTSAIQTPLSHVNLRAIQNNIPNAFIRDPLSIDSIANLLNKYIYFKVEQNRYIIKEASVEEVNAWYENIRPTEEQNPPLNLNYSSIEPLDEITFDMFDGFGAKCTNLAVLRRLGFPEGTVPDGFGIPFYYYMEFMKFNNFFEEIEAIIQNEDFQNNRQIRDEMLDELRDRIKEAPMPPWMISDLSQLQLSFPSGTPIRCRSSTNNEDLPGFNGAGLYTSKTQHPDEGHISKSIKQVYASLWNLRAFEERDFYRVNHFSTAMGVLCHPNFEDEKLNGVGVTTDPIYNTENTFYLNSQLGEELITNPEASSIPEEILLDDNSSQSINYIVVQRSNLAPIDSLLFGEDYLELMLQYLVKIHNEFAILYKAEKNSSFAMDIEYKIDANNQLVIKQARPWVSFIYQENEEAEVLTNQEMFSVYPNPAQEYISIKIHDDKLSRLVIMDITGKQVFNKKIELNGNSVVNVYLERLIPGVYVIGGIIGDDVMYYSKKFVKL